MAKPIGNNVFMIGSSRAPVTSLCSITFILINKINYLLYILIKFGKMIIDTIVSLKFFLILAHTCHLQK